MDKAQPLPLWTYEGNDEALSKWLDGWLIRRWVSPSDVLAWAWFYGEAHEGSEWTRDKELAEWIEASKTNRHAWEGVQLLLRTLRQQNIPMPFALLLWALDVADGTNSPPTRKRGRDAWQNELRDRHIVMAIDMLQCGGLPATSNTGRSACHVVADKLNLSYEAVRTIWLARRNTTIRDWLTLDRGF